MPPSLPHAMPPSLPPSLRSHCHGYVSSELGVAIGCKWRRNSIYRKVTAAMHPRMCMHIFGCIAAVTATVIFLPRSLPRSWRRQWQRHCLPINTPMYFNVTCHITDAMPRLLPHAMPSSVPAAQWHTSTFCLELHRIKVQDKAKVKIIVIIPLWLHINIYLYHMYPIYFSFIIFCILGTFVFFCS